MPVTSNLDGRQYKSWEQDPSTRESLRLFTKRIPIDIELSTPGTAESLFTVSPGQATVNLVTNPSCETGSPPTGYTAVGSTLAQDATYYEYGTKSLKITPDNSAKGEGAYWDLGAFPMDEPLALSTYFRRGAAGSGNVRTELWSSSITSKIAGTMANVRVAIGSTAALGASFVRSSLVSPANRVISVFHIIPLTGTFEEDETITGGTSLATATTRTIGTVGGANTYIVAEYNPGTQFSCDLGIPVSETITGTTSSATGTLNEIERIVLNGNTLRLYMVTVTNIATVFYVDGVQAEVSENVTTYCDGAQGYLHWWDGVAHASTSRRWRGMSSIRSMRLHATRDLYLAYDRDASNDTTVDAEDRGEYIRAGTDFGENHPIYLDDKLSFINRLSGESPRLYGSIDGV